MNLRLLALGGAVACAIALPLAMASAGPAGEGGRADHRAGVHADGRPLSDAAGGRAEGEADRRTGSVVGAVGTGAAGHLRAIGEAPETPSAAPSGSPLTLGLGLATAARCGPELTSPEGVEAQTCVLSQGEDTWARTYYRNATGRALEAFLSLMGPAGRTVQTRCAVAAEDEPESCETPHEPSRGKPAAYTAVTEFAEAIGDGPLLLRSGSNFRTDTGS
ncbi:hypothetical protein ABT300_17260 [Streptomyces sp. NPDC001027]|uniref:hypothetical protein n=1 Tax=Streptomyces sp. NPDC001027 TaxID=3154771 RepID=UPI0033182675